MRVIWLENTKSARHCSGFKSHWVGICECFRRSDSIVALLLRVNHIMCVILEGLWKFATTDGIFLINMQIHSVRIPLIYILLMWWLYANHNCSTETIHRMLYSIFCWLIRLSPWWGASWCKCRIGGFARRRKSQYSQTKPNKTHWVLICILYTL